MRGIIRIDRVVANFEVWPDGQFPFAKFKVKILSRLEADSSESLPGNFLAVPNVAIRSIIDNEADYTSGIGNTVQEALSDLLVRFIEQAQENIPANGFKDSDFVWSECEDF